MDTLLLSYLAGCVDSDGTIGVKRSTYSMRVTGDSTQPAYSERIALRQVTPVVPTLLRDTFGGYLGVNDPSAKRGRPLYSWQVTDLKAASALTMLLPYLRIKREQAENCLALREVKVRSRAVRVPVGRGHVGAQKRPIELGDEMESLYQRAKELNRVGI